MMRGLAFSPETLNQLARCGHILDEIHAKPREQRAFRHRASEVSIIGRGLITKNLITKNLTSIGSGCENIAFSGPLSCRRASHGFPHDERLVPQGPMDSVRPATLKTNRQHRVFGVSGDECALVRRVSVTFGRRHKTGAQHRR